MEYPSIILASASPRRQELLTQIGVNFEVFPVDIDESREVNESPETLVVRLAKQKALAAQRQLNTEQVILGADTLGCIDQTLLCKPRNFEHARQMLLQMSGRSHQIYSAVAVCKGRDNIKVLLNSSRVTFREISETEMLKYWDTGEPQDKAGAYAIQGRGAIFVERLEGSYSAVMGLPLQETDQLLTEFLAS